MRRFSFGAVILVLLAGIAAADYSDTNEVGNVPDNTPAGIVSTVSAVGGGTVTGVEVSLNGFVHSWAGDLIMTVEHEGVTVFLSNRPGIAVEPPFGSDVNVKGNYAFRDSQGNNYDNCIVAADVNSGGSGFLPGGFFRSNNPLADFTGLAVNGDWTLSVSDNGTGDTGSIATWTLAISSEGGSKCAESIGDVNGDGSVNLLDVTPFVDAVSGGDFVCEADVNADGVVNLLDVAAFVALLTGP